jgi:hypothetical protein
MSKEIISMEDKLKIIKKKKEPVVETTLLDESEESEYTYSSSDEEIIIRKKDKTKKDTPQPILEPIADVKIPDVDVIAELALIKQLLSQRRKKSNSKTVVQIMQPSEKEVALPPSISPKQDRMKQYSFLKF